MLLLAQSEVCPPSKMIEIKMDFRERRKSISFLAIRLQLLIVIGVLAAGDVLELAPGGADLVQDLQDGLLGVATFVQTPRFCGLDRSMVVFFRVLIPVWRAGDFDL